MSMSYKSVATYIFVNFLAANAASALIPITMTSKINAVA
jgi:hypothetical protein